MVIEKVPVVALGPTLKVRTLVAAVGLVPNEVVTPFGIPDALSFTFVPAGRTVPVAGLYANVPGTLAEAFNSVALGAVP